MQIMRHLAIAAPRSPILVARFKKTEKNEQRVAPLSFFVLILVLVLQV